jgi:uncharacterized integral membrane protein
MIVIFVCLVGWFAIQNVELTSSIKFFFGEPVEVPSIAVIAVSCLMGILLTIAFGVVDQMRLRRTIKEKTKEIESLEERLELFKQSVKEGQENEPAQ